VSILPLVLWTLPIIMQLTTLACFLVWGVLSRIPLLFRMSLGQFWFALATAVMVILSALPEARTASFSAALFVSTLDLNIVFVLRFTPARRTWMRVVVRCLIAVGIAITALSIWQLLVPAHSPPRDWVVRAGVLYVLAAGSTLLGFVARSIIRRAGRPLDLRAILEGPLATVAALAILGLVFVPTVIDVRPPNLLETLALQYVLLFCMIALRGPRRLAVPSSSGFLIYRAMAYAQRVTVWFMPIVIADVAFAHPFRGNFPSLAIHLVILNVIGINMASLAFFRGLRAGSTRDASSLPAESQYGLSRREQEVRDMLLRGLRYAEIGDALFIARTTVKSHAQAVYRAYGVANRRELIQRASASSTRPPDSRSVE